MPAKNAWIDSTNPANRRDGVSVEQISGGEEKMIRSLRSLGSRFSPGLELRLEIEEIGWNRGCHVGPPLKRFGLQRRLIDQEMLRTTTRRKDTDANLLVNRLQNAHCPQLQADCREYGAR